MPTGRNRTWPADNELLDLLARHGGNMVHAAAALDVPRQSLAAHVGRRKLGGRLQDLRADANRVDGPGEDPHLQRVRKLVSGKAGKTVEEIADDLDVAPRHARGLLDQLRHDGYRVPDEEAPGSEIRLEKVVPDKTSLHKSLLSGDEVRVGVVSDTHLCSNEEALPELNLAYDTFARQGITEVWHPGDIVSGVGIFRTQAAEIKCHTFESQVDYAHEHYPQRDGITTRLIGGNHDLEGDFGRIGADPCQAIANRRDDIDYLGPYSAWLELPNGAHAHLLHGKGGMSYAFSYKAQKLVDGYPAGRKPAILVCGHWHVAGNIEQRGVQVLWPACFEWRSPFMARLGLSPSVGFWILNLALGDDGSLVRWRPEFFRYWQGRTAEAA